MQNLPDHRHALGAMMANKIGKENRPAFVFTIADRFCVIASCGNFATLKNGRLVVTPELPDAMVDDLKTAELTLSVYNTGKLPPDVSAARAAELLAREQASRPNPL